ncbi:phospholipase D-like domain-containing protein [Halosolutus halophilus]|uniref:phospholipase D-like domain-containing protein n=1 Tax=Halosolutus halophilus TaxID=1552990 RepID=UPI0022351B5F|nr:phospholipase D-like domain-containing protein [Halosolutus halophilus]
MSRDIDDAATLAVANPVRLWGVSPESVYTALDATARGRSVETALARYRRVELAATNEERDLEALVSLHRRLLVDLGFVDAEQESETDPVSEVGALVLCGEDPRSLLQTLAVARWQSARRLLRECLAIDGELPREEYDGLLRDDWEETVLTPLLGSFGLLTAYPTGVDVADSAAQAGLDAYDEVPTDIARASLYRRVLSSAMNLDATTAADITGELLDVNPGGEVAPADVIGTLGEGYSRVIDRDVILEAAGEVRVEYEQMARRYRRLATGDVTVPERADEVHHVASEDVDPPSAVASVDAVLDLVATIADGDLGRIDTGYVTDALDAEPYDCFRVLNDVPGFECELVDETVEVARVPSDVAGTSRYDEYVEYLLDRHATVSQRIDALSDPEFELEGRHADANLVDRLDRLRDRQVAPTYFAYTLIDPESLGEEAMDDYVGDSRGLRRERARLKRWHEDRPSGLRSYTAMTDRLISLGLEEDLEHRVLRIMTPFDDDTFSEYAAQLRRLLEQGFELRLLTRHTKEPWEWRRLRDNLLAQLESNRENVHIRTYSRFKTHQRITRDLDLRDLSEVGIHGKLHVIGAPEEGAALLGSANFMENSYHWNPECGVYTEQSAFVDSATEFFDIVWDIAEADQLSLERLQEIPERRFIPSYYS